MNSRKSTHLLKCIWLTMALGSVANSASATAITKQYGALAFINGSVGNDNLSLWSSNIGQSPPSEWNDGQAILAWFNRVPFNPNFYPHGQVPDATYNNVPFTISIYPTISLPSNPQGYKFNYSVTGPASDGAVIHGVLNGTFYGNGQSDVVATFQSITPNDMAARFRQDYNVGYVIDPTLPNPFPIDRMVLPKSLELNRDGYTDIYATILPDPVPEPTALVLFLPLPIALAYRCWNRRNNLGRPC
jgi:hypothetical protein